MKHPHRAFELAQKSLSLLVVVFFVATCTTPRDPVVGARCCFGQVSNQYEAVVTYDPSSAQTTVVVTGTNRCDETPATIDALSVTLYKKDASGNWTRGATTTVHGNTATIATPSDTKRIGFSAPAARTGSRQRSDVA